MAQKSVWRQVLEEMGVITEPELMEGLLRQHSPFADIAQKKQLGDILVQAKLMISEEDPGTRPGAATGRG